MRLSNSLPARTDPFAAIQHRAASSRGRLSGLRRWTVVLLAAIAALSTAVLTAQAQPPTVTISATRSTAVVGLDNVQFDLTRTGAATGELDVTVNLSETGGAFLTGTQPPMVTFSAGSSTNVLRLATSQFSSTASGNSTLTATIDANSEDYTVGTSGSADVSLSGVSGAAVTVKFSPASYSFNEAAAAGQLTVIAEMADGLPAPAQVTIPVSLSSVEATGANAATSGTDFTPLSAEVSFNPSAFIMMQDGRQVASVTRTLEIMDDDAPEADETLIVRLQAASGTPAKVAFADGTSEATVTIIDDDPPPSVTLVLSNDSISENGGTTDVTATLSAASDTAFTVTVTVAAAPGSGADFTLSSPATLSFEANATTSSNTVTITARNNDVDASDKAVTVSGTASIETVSAPADKTLTITDDDTRGVTVSPTSLTFVEEANGAYTVKLDSQPTAEVTVAVARAAGSDTDVSVMPQSLTFSTTNWETKQSVTVSAALDTDTTDDSARIEHTVSGGDYQGLAANPVMVTVTDNTPPGQVTGVTVTPAAGSLVVVWTAVSSATGYKVQWRLSTETDADYDQHTISSGSTTTYTIPNLDPTPTYTVRVIATRENANDGMPSSPGVAARPLAPKPAQVTNVTAVKTTAVGELKVDWTAVSNADGYKVQWKLSSESDTAYDTNQHPIPDGSTKTYTIPSLTPGTSYDVRVIATRTNAEGDGDPSEPVMGTPRASKPGQVTGVMAEKTSTVGELKVDWTAATNADGYKVQWKSGMEDYDPATRQRTVSDGSAITDTIPGLTGATAYTVRVIATRAHASDGTPSDGAPGTPKPQPPEQVTGVTAAETNIVGELMVSWPPADNAGGYLVQWKSGGQPYNTTDRQHTISSGATVTDTITGLAGGTEYTVQVTATRTNADNGQPSSGATGTPRAEAPGQVTGVTAAKTDAVGELMVNWTAATNADGYKVQWKSGMEDYDPATRQRTVSDGSAITDTIPGLTGATAYTVRVIATRAHASDGIPVEAPGTPRASKPGQVGNVTATPAVESLVVRWNQVTNADGYKVQWRLSTETDADYDTTRQHVVSSGTTLTYTIPNLDHTLTYTVQVTATREHADDGTSSSGVAARPRAPEPAKVGTVELTVGIRQLGVSWPQATDADGYLVQWKSGGLSYSTTDRQHTITSATTRTDTITGLTPGTPYTVQVIATRANADNGRASDEQTETPKAEKPAKVTGLSATPVVRGLDLEWTAAPTSDGQTAEGYVVQWKLEAQTYNATDRQHTITSATTSYTITGLDPAMTYTVRVRGTRTHADPGEWSEPPATTGRPMTDPPAKVTELTLTREVRQLVVTWKQATNAGGYKVQWKSGMEDYDPATRQRTLSRGSTLTDTIPSLTPGTPYTVQVIATRDNAPDGTQSDAQTATPKIEPPGEVTNVAVTPQVEKLAVAWSAAINAGGYKVQWKSGSEAYDPTTREHRIAGGNVEADTISGLDHTVTYTVRVLATRQHADDGDADEAAGRPRAPAPAQVTGVTVTPGARQLAVNWTAVTNADGYRVQWRLSTETDANYDATRQAVIGSGSRTSNTIAALDHLLTYTVRVIATRDNADDGPPSAGIPGRPKNDPPGEPMGLFRDDADTTDTTLYVGWNTVFDADTYRVEWAPLGGSYGGDRTHTLGENEIRTGRFQEYIIRNLSPGTSYKMRVFSVRDNADDSTPSETTGTTLGEAPETGGSTTATVTPQVGALTVSWTAVSGATLYQVQWKSGNQAYAGDRQQDYTDGSTSHTITNLTAGTTYTVRVITTVEGVGVGEESPEVTGVVRAAAPGAVASVTLTPEVRRLSVSWVAATDADGYRVQWKSGDQDYNEGDRQQEIDNGIATVITNLDARNTYTVRVAATRQYADDGTSAEASAAPLAALPGQVTGLTAAERGDTTIRLTWTAPTDDGGADITGYRIEESDDGGTSDAWADLAANTDTPATTYDDTSLSPGTTRHYRVSAINSAGPGTASSSDSATTRTQGNQTPVFADGASASRALDENSEAEVAVGSPVAATDPEDDLLAYSLGGTDAASFAIDADNGQLRVLAALNHEEKDTYEVTVTVTDALAAEASIPVTIAVTDVDEPPAAPVAPTVTATSGTIDGLTVTWTAPDNTGPPVTSYDLQYRTGISGPFTDGPQDVIAISATLEELQPNTRYQVQVRATNDEGDGLWSGPGSASTSAQPNRAPVFDEGATATRSVAENTAADGPIGTPLTATDADGNSLTYSLQEAAAELFGIVPGSGQLLVLQVPDFEATETHTVVVQVTDGRGGSEAITVTVEVTDEDEPPAAPAEPTVTATSGTIDGLTVTWTMPDNTGPPITGYDLQYREPVGGEFIDGPQNVAETSATLGELTEVTVYEVQVRATNDEGTSSWSSSGLGSTSSSANATPEFVEGVSAERSVAENTAAGEAIGEPLTATDANADDTLTYALEGTDAASFAIDADSGQLRSLAALDFETNTIYAVTVRADDDQGNSGRIAVTINITDQTEPPAEPAVLTVTTTSGTTDSLTVTWTAPDNTGPPITGYDLQYVESVGGEFSDGPQNVAETSAVITGLMEDTPYVVQVRARNADGVSGWSRLSGVGRTGAPDGGEMATVTVAAARSTAIAGLDFVQFDLTRTGATTEALGVTVNLSQTRSYLTDATARTVTFGAGSSTASLLLGSRDFSSTAAGSGTLTATVAAGDGYSVGTAGSASVSLSAVSGAAMTVKLSASSYSFNEDAVSADRQVTVVAEMAQGLPAPGSAVSVTLQVGELGGPSGASSGADFTPLNAQVSIVPMAFSMENGRQVARVTQVLAITDDAQSESDEMLDVRLWASPGTPTSFGTPAKVAFENADGTSCRGFTGECFSIVTIADDDAAMLTVSPAELTIVEGGGAIYTVVRTTQPRGNVTVRVEGASGDVTVSPTTLTFTVNDWDDPQTVTVNTTADDDTETDASVTLTHTASGGGYDGTVASVVVRVEEVVRAANNQNEVENEQVSEGDSKVFEVDVDDDATAAKTVIQVRVASGDLDDGSLQVSESESANELAVSVTGGLLDGAVIRVPLSEDQAGDTIEVSISLADTGDGMVNDAANTPPPANVEPSTEPLVVDISVPSGTYVCLPYDPAPSGAPVIYHFDGLRWERQTVMNQEVMGGQVCGTVMMASPFGVFYEVAEVEADASAAQVAQAWQARFNRTVADQVVDAVVDRLSTRRGTGTNATVAGRPVGEGSGGAGGQAAWGHPRPPSGLLTSGEPGVLGDPSRDGVTLSGEGPYAPRSLTELELLTGSAFHLATEGADGGLWSLWGRGAYSRFDAGGELSLDGNVSTGMVGADYGGKRLLGGLVLSHSQGSGTYSLTGLSGEIESSLTGLYPYLGFALGERVSVWGVLGRGRGTLSMSPDGADAVETDIEMTMAALGLRGELVPASASGLALALKTDLLVMRSTSDAAFNLAALEADVSRWRLSLEGSRALRLYRGGLLTPIFEVGLRHDDGDAETGTGVEVGGGFRYTGSALTLELKARGLLMHEAEDFRQWGVSGTLRYDPTPSSERGLSASLTQSWGASAAGGAEALWSRNAASGMASTDTLESVGPLHAELGYGLSTLGGTGTPWVGYTMSDVGRDYRLGYRFDFARQRAMDLGLSLEASRREGSYDDDKPEHGLMLLGVLNW